MTAENILVTNETTIKEALKKLDISANRVLLVIDASGVLAGTLTDGDVRRALLAGAGMESAILGVCNTNPSVLYEYECNEANIRSLFLSRKLDLIPVLNRDRTVARCLTWSDFFSGKVAPERPRAKVDIPCVIMAGGKGTRMAPFTNVLPKPLIPIGDKTILEHIMEQFAASGVFRFIFTINYRAEMIRAYFEGVEHKYNIEYVREREFLGTAGSLRLLGESVPVKFFVSNCDIIVKADFAKVAEFHDQSESWLTIVSAIQHNKLPYGVVDFGLGGKVTEIREKPEYSFTINTGVYLLDSRCIEFIPEGRPFDMPDLIKALMADGKPVHTYPLNESEYIDVGQWDEYRSAIDKINGTRS